MSNKKKDNKMELTEEQAEQLKNLDVEDEVEHSGQRQFDGYKGIILMAFAAIISLAHIYFLVFNPIDPMKLRALHVLSLSALGFLLVPMSEKYKDRMAIIDWFGIVACLLIFVYLFSQFDQLIWRIRVSPDPLDVVMAIAGIAMVLELVRRTSGKALLILSFIFLGYGLFGDMLPRWIAHSGIGWQRFFGYMYSDYGIFSEPVAISSRYIVLFIIFAAFLTVSGVGRFFVQWAFAVSGFARGGPAKVSILASALMGTMNGTSAGNAVATGSLTIPLMKKVGYTPRFAAATESVASAGGQVMPPIMGAGIFLMAELTGIPYQRIMLAGIIPALLYFFSAYLMVDYEAIKLNLKGFPRKALPDLRHVLKRSYLFLPVIILFYMLLTGWSIIMAGFIGIVSCFIISWLHALVEYISQKKTGVGMNFMHVVQALEKGARGTIQLMSVCAAAGIIMGVIGQTGIGLRFANMLLGIAGANQLLALVFAMGVSILLGMGMPTTAAYAIGASILAPGLTSIGLPTLVAHMFVFYFACLSAITPPVALAAYAASGISGSDPMKTSYLSFRLGLTAYIVPYMFYYAPALILGNTEELFQLVTVGADGAEVVGELAMLTVVLRTITALIGVYGIASAVQSWYFGLLENWKRALVMAAGLLLVTPPLWADISGVVILVVVAFLQINASKDQSQEVSSESSSI
ncbi:TRAP transporter permease [Natranaerofaba carboxydovora]|uniref:TRAP transporter permease n=1 Tax=Natranaerofaba carboxydovora TaxID=2742683 RepID=UPI001F13D2D9|nr:TRAP transporter permease [Natranaerofaba carboxydovora]UMZ74185.1 C4-dicarboxylate TRAP transporter large permease protein DctM [Natranaerofaba carboxydovora]